MLSHNSLQRQSGWSPIFTALALVSTFLAYFCFGTYIRVISSAELLALGTSHYDFVHNSTHGPKYADLSQGTLLRCQFSDLEKLEFHSDGYTRQQYYNGIPVANRRGSLITVSSIWFGYKLGIVRSTEFAPMPWNVLLNRMAWIWLALALYLGFKAIPSVEENFVLREEPVKSRLFD